MDYTNAMMVWDAVSVRIADVCHGTIAREQMELTSENALLLFVLGKDARVTAEDTPYALRGETLFHIGRGRHVRMSAAGKAEYYCVSYQAETPQAVGREMARLFWLNPKFCVNSHEARTDQNSMCAAADLSDCRLCAVINAGGDGCQGRRQGRRSLERRAAARRPLTVRPPAVLFGHASGKIDGQLVRESGSSPAAVPSTFS